MRQVANSADSLVLLGEMVEMASGYADQVEESSAHDDPFMVRLAHDQLSYLLKRVAKLDEKLKTLSGLLGSKTRRLPRSRSRKWATEGAQGLGPTTGLSEATN